MSGDRTRALRRAGERLLRRRVTPDGPRAALPLWDADFWGLTHVARFRDVAPERQRTVLDACAESALAESWFIEKSGIAFCARMVLLAEGLEEQRVFALIGADEATHTSWLEPWLMPPADTDPFNRFIGGLVESGTAQPLAYLLQVVLEGFGIAHYAGLAAHCRDAALAGTLRRMAEDEALHHAGGLAAFRAERLTASERTFVAEGAYEFLRMMRSGPQAVAAALDRGIGMAGLDDATRVFDALAGETAGAAKLERLRRLMAQPGMEWLVNDLDRTGAFVPCTTVQSAQLYVAQRSVG